MTLEKALEKEFKGNKILLISLKSKVYRDSLKGIINFSTKAFKKVCYITLNYPASTIESKMGIKSASNMTFIDCVSSTVKTPKDKKNTTFVSSPHALTEISIASKKMLEKEKVDFVVFDSVSALLVYEEPLTVMKFIHSLILTYRDADVGTSFLILKEDVSEGMLKDMSMFVDRIMEV